MATKEKKKPVTKATEVPEVITQITKEFMIDYASQDRERATAFVQMAEEKVVNDNGETVEKPFMQLRREFVDKFMPELKAKKKSNKGMTKTDKMYEEMKRKFNL